MGPKFEIWKVKNWRSLFWTLLTMCFPVAVIWYARWIFNEIIEPEKISFNFFVVDNVPFLTEDLANSAGLSFIPGSVIESLYNFGFAACAATALSAVLVVYSATQVWRFVKATPILFGTCYILACVVAAVWIAFSFYGQLAAKPEMGQPTVGASANVEIQKMVAGDNGPSPDNRRLRAALSRPLIAGTLKLLPWCEDTTPRNCHGPGIGNIGSSVLDVLAIVSGIVSVAGLSYLVAAASIVANPGSGGNEEKMLARKAQLNTLTYLAGIAFFTTVVATHLLFQPGTKMIAEAYEAQASKVQAQTLERQMADTDKNDVLKTKAANTEADKAKTGVMSSKLLAEQNYSALSNAMTLYWAIIFSLAMAATFFTASAGIDVQSGFPINFGGVADFTRIALTVISPLLASGLMKIAEAFIKSTAS